MMWPQQKTKQGGGKAGGKGAGNNLPAMEAKLAENAWAFYEKILHLDITMPALQKEWSTIADLRTNILGAYGIVTPLGTTAPSSGVIAPNADLVEGETKTDDNWKGKLQQLVSKRVGKSLVKGEIVYQTADAPSGGFVASCASAHLAREYSGEVAAPSKKGAETEAAKAALKAEFPAEFQTASGVAPAPKGQKRKADALEATPLDPKTKLNQSMMLLLGRTLTKTDLVFETVATGENVFSTTLTIPEYDAAAVFKSGNKESKKVAENAAAENALKKWANKLSKLEAEQKAKKDEVKKQKLEALKTATKAKKEAKQAQLTA